MKINLYIYIYIYIFIPRLERAFLGITYLLVRFKELLDESRFDLFEFLPVPRILNG